MRSVDICFDNDIRAKHLDYGFKFVALARELAEAIHVAGDLRLGQQGIYFDQSASELLEPVAYGTLHKRENRKMTAGTRTGRDGKEERWVAPSEIGREEGRERVC